MRTLDDENSVLQRNAFLHFSLAEASELGDPFPLSFQWFEGFVRSISLLSSFETAHCHLIADVLRLYLELFPAGAAMREEGLRNWRDRRCRLVKAVGAGGVADCGDQLELLALSGLWLRLLQAEVYWWGIGWQGVVMHSFALFSVLNGTLQGMSADKVESHPWFACGLHFECLG